MHEPCMIGGYQNKLPHIPEVDMIVPQQFLYCSLKSQDLCIAGGILQNFKSSTVV